MGAGVIEAPGTTCLFIVVVNSWLRTGSSRKGTASPKVQQFRLILPPSPI